MDASGLVTMLSAGRMEKASARRAMASAPMASSTAPAVPQLSSGVRSRGERRRHQRRAPLRRRHPQGLPRIGRYDIGDAQHRRHALRKARCDRRSPEQCRQWRLRIVRQRTIDIVLDDGYAVVTGRRDDRVRRSSGIVAVVGLWKVGMQ